ncbi:16S rRNA (guanine(527)-N(7))-methyltransferase RsmG [Thermovibrio ammonificans]|uniref:Ribosomal RNA small subunit methyltransferase G n=1 Tax=Thermovibrio ammonificans (strain DSM 15698 / JCM 12110 / HB-1) TaxID=648996 RepID=E8T5H1_THEA1|nr:16S rRNA (guanine(527)-N(7))-methyltransferase RsmG [Thermovibrio ammonificans]ADU97625.1 methyltransferase GidB [Thermovibrio ammonificans HB-1]
MKRLRELCTLNGIELKEEHYQKLELFKELLKKWGRRINLTSLLDDTQIEEKHLFDSLLGLKAFKEAGINVENASICDVGSGGGFPGVPLAVALENADFTLVEPRKKRCVFLEEVKRRLNLKNVKVACSRIEDVSGPFNLLTMRAVEDPEGAVKITEHLLKEGAVLCIYRGKERFQKSIPGYKIREITVEPKGVNFTRRFLFIEKQPQG